MSENYADIANLSWDNIPKVKLLPDGSWRLRGRNATFLAPKEEGNARVLFFYTPQEPMEDVEPTELAKLGDDYDVTGNQIVHTVWIERPTDWDKVRKHLETAGVEAAGGIQDSFKAFRNSEVIAHVSSRTFTTKAGENVEENVASSFTKVV